MNEKKKRFSRKDNLKIVNIRAVPDLNEDAIEILQDFFLENMGIWLNWQDIISLAFSDHDKCYNIIKYNLTNFLKRDQLTGGYANTTLNIYKKDKEKINKIRERFGKMTYDRLKATTFWKNGEKNIKYYLVKQNQLMRQSDIIFFLLMNEKVFKNLVTKAFKDKADKLKYEYNIN